MIVVILLILSVLMISGVLVGAVSYVEENRDRRDK